MVMVVMSVHRKLVTRGPDWPLQATTIAIGPIIANIIIIVVVVIIITDIIINYNIILDITNTRLVTASDRIV